MSEVATSSRTSTVRRLTWTVFAAVPALAIVTIGSGVLTGNLSGGTTPSNATVAETREFSVKGDDLAALTGAKADGSDEAALGQWQNTVRRRPSPRR
jgi:hypothetical protein